MNIFMKFVTTGLICGTTLGSGWVGAETIRADKYYLFNIQFDEKGYYLHEGVRSIPCPIVQETNRGNGNDSPYFVRDVTGKAVQQGMIVFPRVAYIESGEEPVGLLRTGRVEFKVPVTAQLATFEFWEKRDQQGPSVRVNLDQVQEVKTVCEPPVPPPDARRTQ